MTPGCGSERAAFDGILVGFRRSGYTLYVAGNEARAERLTANQTAVCAENDRMQRLAFSFRFHPGQGVPFRCECVDPGCSEIVMLSLDDYDRLRAHPNWFLIVAGHEDTVVAREQVVEEENGHAIVEKVASGRS